jgi:iron complex outermembrane receptor protein
MSNSLPSHPVRRRAAWKAQPPFRLSPIGGLVAGLSLLAAMPLQAADDKIVADLQAELARANADNARISAENARLKQALEGGGKVTPTELAAPATAAAAANEAAAVVAKSPDEPVSLDAIEVRTRARIERLQDVPLSVSVVSGAELNRELAQDLGAITKRGANITFNQNNTRGANLSIRGLGKGRQFQETQDPSVGIILDGVSLGLAQLANFDFYDVDSVEVTRGPQGTLGGKGGSTGVVTVNSKLPSFSPSADFELAYGQRETVIAKSNFGGAVIDDLLAWRGSLIVDKSRGYYVNQFDPNYSLYDKDRVSGRTQFLLTPTPALSARLSFDFEPRAPQVQNGLTVYTDQPFRYANGSLTDPSGTTARAKMAGFTNSSGSFTAARNWFVGRSFNSGSNDAIGGVYSYDRNYTGFNNINFNENQGQTVSNRGASAEIDWNVANHTLTSITGWRSSTFDAHNDEGTPFDISRNGGGGVYYSQYSQEFRIASAPGGVLDYTGGLFAFKTRDDIVSKTGWGSDAGAWFATTAQYNTLDRNAGVNRGAGLALLRDSLADAETKGDTWVNTRSNAIFGQLNWRFAEAATLTAGARATWEHRTSEDTKFLMADGFGAALDPVAVRGVPLGGFASDATGALGAANSDAQKRLADAVASRYFGATPTTTPGAAYNGLAPEQRAQIAAAKAIRAGQIGALISGVKGTYNDTLYSGILSPSYKFNENLTGYTSWQHGEKSGSVVNVNGVSTIVRPEKTDAYEVGLKSSLLDKTLILNADVFLMNIRDYQTTVRAVDEFATQTNIANGQANPLVYVTAQGNVPRVRAKGLEFDGVYSGVTHTTLRFSGAYNDARYVEFRNAAKPDELGYLAANFIDQSGLTLPGAAKWTFNLGAEYRRPVFGDKVFHASFNTAYTSRFNNTDTLSSYGWIEGHSVTDASVGLGTKSSLDLTLVVKNLFDNRSHEQAWSSYSPDPYPRWVGLVLSGKL